MAAGCAAGSPLRQTVEVHVHLDPVGSVPLGLLLVVGHETGVIYEHLSSVGSGQEGYLVPLGGPDEAAPFARFFAVGADGQGAPGPVSRWRNGERLELRSLVAGVTWWEVHEDGASPQPLTLDDTRLDQVTAGWVPVHTPEGPGVLVIGSA